MKGLPLLWDYTHEKCSQRPFSVSHIDQNIPSISKSRTYDEQLTSGVAMSGAIPIT